MLMAAAQLLARQPPPTLAEIREGLAGNLCRCTGFMRIFESVVEAAANEETCDRRAGGTCAVIAEALEMIAPGTSARGAIAAGRRAR